MSGEQTGKAGKCLSKLEMCESEPTFHVREVANPQLLLMSFHVVESRHNIYLHVSRSNLATLRGTALVARAVPLSIAGNRRIAPYP